jgi:hypothetical protein
VSRSEQGVPPGWHQATVREALAHNEAIQAQMGEWFIAELVDGKVAGPGYGGSVETCVPERLGHLVILRNRGDTVPDSKPSTYTHHGCIFRYHSYQSRYLERRWWPA